MKNIYGKELNDFTRLTRHYQDWEVELAKPNKDYVTIDYFCPRRDVSYDDCLNKLGQLEDIMEKYGINSAEELEHVILNDATSEQTFRDYIKPYKDIEEELGIDLITLFKALKEPAYIVVNDKIVETYCGHIGEECKTIDFEIDGKDYKNLYDIETFYVLTKDYGKTWALTKEELL